jgi:sortase A
MIKPAGADADRRPMRRMLRSLSSILIFAGLLLVADAILTVTWQEPTSALYAQLEQRKLDSSLAELEAGRPRPVERRALASLKSPSRRLAFAARSLDRRAREGQPLGRIRVPRIDLSTVVVAGTDTGTLRKGPGHYPDTPLPGVRGTVGVAGHRTTYGAPFRRIDKLRKGDRVTLDMPYGRFEYSVERTRIVPPTATWVTDRVSYDRLILSACHPLYSAAKRIVVFARLMRSEPHGSALI